MNIDGLELFGSLPDALRHAQVEAAQLKARFDVVALIREQVSSWHLSHDQAAERLGLAPPRLRDLLYGQVDRFSLDELFGIAASAGLRLQIEAKAAS